MGGFGGGSSGGGGGSGRVDYPAYMKTFHGDLLNDTGTDLIVQSVVDCMNSAMGNSPWTMQSAYNPDADLVDLIAAPEELQTLVTLLSSGTTLDTLIASILDTTRIDDEITAYTVDMDARLISEVLPRFEAGMRDINAVISSAFVIGRALIEQNQDRQVAKFAADTRNKAFSDDALKVIGMKLEYQKNVSQMIAESYRVKIVAKKEEVDVNMKIDEADALWDLELFKYGGNMLAAIAGAAVTQTGQKISGTQSMIGGAMVGAMAGAQVGGPWGAVIGGVLGAAAGLLK
jgi:hypothetical protein